MDDLTETSRVAIIGGGLAGSLLTLALAQKGYGVDLYERQADLRQRNGRAGRSINLGLSQRGMLALRMVGLLDTMLDRSVTMKGRVIHAPDGTTRYQPYGKDASEVLHSIDRNELNALLLDRAELYAHVSLHFEHRVTRVDRQRREITFDTPLGEVTATPPWMVGADGAFSVTRRELQYGERANYSQEYLEWGYKELTLEPSANGDSAIELTALHVWPRGHCLIVSHPNRNHSHTLTAFLPFQGPDSFASIQAPDDVEAMMNKYFPDLRPLLPDLTEQWMKHPVGSLITIRTSPWAFGDWAVLVGDACHAVYPFYGQGMNAAFEDCCVLVSKLTEHDDVASAFRAYELARREHTDVLCELSKANFVELRRKVQSPWFVARKRLDVILNRLWPNHWLPLYTMVSHTAVPYATAVARVRRREFILAVAALGIVVVISLLVTLSLWRRA